MKKPVYILDAGQRTVVGTRATVMRAVKGGYLKFAYNPRRPASDVAHREFALTSRSLGADDRTRDYTRCFKLETLKRTTADDCHFWLSGNA
jgi:hypothetical protein